MACQHTKTFVTDSRSSDDAQWRIKYKKFDLPVSQVRRRQCIECGERFSTMEINVTILEDLVFKANKARSCILQEILEYLENKSEKT